jgi:hypothetical protein
MPEAKILHLREKIRHFLRLDRLNPVVRGVLVSLVGGLITLAGIMMLVTPGPAIILIPLGLMILGLEFSWADKALTKVMDWLKKMRAKWKNRKSRRTREA